MRSAGLNAVKTAVGLAALLGSVHSARAQDPVRAPDPKNGEVIVAQGIGTGVPACAQCHAFNGESDGSGAFPRLAGQSAVYLAKQLREFASGIRNSAVMTQLARSMSTEQIADVAAYYANMSAPFPPLKPLDPTLIKRGKQLARVGSASDQTPSCNACHGPDGAGEPPDIPYLAGQYSPYIALNLQMWQRGFRKNSPESMAAVASRLSPDDIQAVSAFYQQVRDSLAASAPNESH
jgi:cytochrome c553